MKRQLSWGSTTGSFHGSASRQFGSRSTSFWAASDQVTPDQLDHRFLCGFPQIALAIGVLTPSVGVRVHRFFGFYLGGLSGRVWSEVLVVSSDVRLVVHMSECTQIFWICLWGATRFFNVMMQHFYFVFAAALLQFTTQGNTVKGRVKNN